MKSLALMLWLIVVSLLVCIIRVDSTRMVQRQQAPQSMDRGLLMITTAEPVNISDSLPATLPEGCSRLGIFPRRDWAEHVAMLLAKAPLNSEWRNSMQSVSSIEPSWQIQRTGRNEFYLQFDEWSVDELAERMMLQRSSLKRLVSVRSIPEPCEQ